MKPEQKLERDLRLYGLSITTSKKIQAELDVKPAPVKRWADMTQAERDALKLLYEKPAKTE